MAAIFQVHSGYSLDMSRAWRDDVPKCEQEDEIMQEPGAPLKSADAKPWYAEPIAIEILLRMEASFNKQFAELSSQVAGLSTQVRQLNDTVVALNQQVTNLTTMSGCDKLKTLWPCGNHLKTVSMRGLTERQTQLITQSRQRGTT
jgi:hypothetical protein